jgi:hypothetical protein
MRVSRSLAIWPPHRSGDGIAETSVEIKGMIAGTAREMHAF